jgi:hypothetical protein
VDWFSSKEKTARHLYFLLIFRKMLQAFRKMLQAAVSGAR